MKKIISILLVICTVIAPLSITVSATQVTNSNYIAQTSTTETPKQSKIYEPLNSNFKKRVVFSEEEVDLEALGIADWCREDFIQLYELGFTELAQTNYIEYDKRMGRAIPAYKFARYSIVISTFYKLLKMYYGEEIDVTQNDVEKKNYYVMLDYLTQKGVLLSEESEAARKNCNFLNIDFGKDYTTYNLPAYSFGREQAYNQGSTMASRQDIQVLLTRLFDIIDVGDPINSLNKITDVDASNSNNINFEGVLELYNLGIFAGNSYGAFNAHDCITINEFVTVLSRIIFPNKRVNIDSEDYYKKMELPYSTIQTYNSISPYWYERIKEISTLDALYIGNISYNDVMTYGEIEYITSFIFKCECKNEAIEPLEIGSKEYIECLKSTISVGNLSEEEELNLLCAPMSKKDFAKKLVIKSEQTFIKMEQSNRTLENPLAQSLSKEDFRLLAKAVSLGIIEDTVEDFSNEAITKADFEKMLIQFMIKFSTIIALNISKEGDERINLVTDPNLLPSNYEYFAYITDMTPKEVYESIDLSKADDGCPTAEHYIEINGKPSSLYNPFYVNYDITLEEITGFFDVVLNIDYRTITAELLAESLNEYTLATFGKYTADDVIDYVNYVKENKIILSGKGTPDFSTMYYCDIIDPPAFLRFYSLACKIEVNVINSEVENPKIFIINKSSDYFTDENNPAVKYAFIMTSTYASFYNGNDWKIAYKPLY